MAASKVLLVWKNTVFCGRRREGGLDFPGGWARPLETPAECAIRELREETEVDSNEELDQLGSPLAVGERLRRDVIAPEGTGRDAELLEARERESSGHKFYDFEFLVHLDDRDRHGALRRSKRKREWNNSYIGMDIKKTNLWVGSVILIFY